jgi:4-deoxy-L-threo-5-hexosulose-uronate ketol-isomerase
MFAKTYHATHPDMMDSVSNEALRDRYLVSGMFVAGEVNLNYSHNERFVIGGAVPGAEPLPLPARLPRQARLAIRCSRGARWAWSTSAPRLRHR